MRLMKLLLKKTDHFQNGLDWINFTYEPYEVGTHVIEKTNA